MSLALTSRRAALLPGRWVSNELWRRARAVPSLDLRFAENKSLVDSVSGQSLITFTRASTGTYVDSDGVIRSAATNLLLRSEEFDNAAWTAPDVPAAVTANAGTAPNGDTSADLIAGVSAAADQIYQTVTVANATAYTLSCFIKSVDTTLTRIGIFLPPSTWLAYVDITWTAGVPSTGSTSGSPTNITYTNYGNGWYRCSFTATTATTSYQIHFHPDRTNNQKSALLWGAQLEVGSTATAYIPTGATINSAPRFDHNPLTGECLGLLIEEQRANLLQHSQNLSDAWWALSNSTLPSITELAPDGTNTAVKWVFDSASSVSALISTNIAKAATATTYTFSSWAKPAGYDLFRLYVCDAANNGNRAEALIQLTTGFVSSGLAFGTFTDASTTITAFPNGWYRCTLTFTTSTETSINVRFNRNDALSPNGTDGLILWGVQLEEGAFPTSYIPTTTDPATRTADVASITTVGGNVRNLFTSFRSPASGTRPVVSLDDNTANERIEILTSGTDPKLLVTDGGSAVADLNGGTVTANVLARIAARFNTDDYAVSINGGTSQLDAAGALPTVNRIRIGSNQAGGYLSGLIARVTAWDSTLPLLPSISQ